MLCYEIERQFPELKARLKWTRVIQIADMKIHIPPHRLLDSVRDVRNRYLSILQSPGTNDDSFNLIKSGSLILKFWPASCSLNLGTNTKGTKA